MQTKLFSPCLASFIIKSSSESLSLNFTDKTCQDCGQLRPFTVKRTYTATNRVILVGINCKNWKDSSMRLAFRQVTRFGSDYLWKVTKMHWFFFCQIIMWSPMNSNVSNECSVNEFLNGFFSPSKIVTARLEITR